MALHTLLNCLTSPHLLTRQTTRVEELRTAWALVKESYEEAGEPIPVAPARRNYSGQFNVRIDKRIHRALAIEAAQAGISLNALVAQKLAKDVKHSNP